MPRLIRIEIDPEAGGDVSYFFSDAPEKPFSSLEFETGTKTRTYLDDIDDAIDNFRINVEQS